MANAAFEQSLSNFTVEDVTAIGLSSDFYQTLNDVSRDLKTQREAIAEAITSKGGTPYRPGTYRFPISDVAVSMGILVVIGESTTAVYVPLLHTFIAIGYLG